VKQQLSKNRQKAEDKLQKGQLYDLTEASKLVKEVNTASFDASVDLHVRLAVDPRKADQAIRGTVSLPHGTGKTKKVLVFCEPDQEEEAKAAGADYVGLDEYIDKVQGGWVDVDVVIATPSVMPKIAKLGRVLGPRNLMPNPKVGTVTDKLTDTVQDVKKGKVSFRVDKFGIIHSTIGRVSFSADQLYENAKALLQTLIKLKPASAKGNYLKSIYMASTMSPGIQIDPKTV
jgi:large subunit ribosomal protein L1